MLVNNYIGVCVCVCVCVCCISLCVCSVMSDPLQAHGLYSPPGASIHGILQARILELSCHFLLQGIFLTQGSKRRLLSLLHWQVFFTTVPPRKPITSVYMCIYMCLCVCVWLIGHLRNNNKRKKERRKLQVGIILKLKISIA